MSEEFVAGKFDARSAGGKLSFDGARPDRAPGAAGKQATGL